MSSKSAREEKAIDVIPLAHVETNPYPMRTKPEVRRSVKLPAPTSEGAD